MNTTNEKKKLKNNCVLSVLAVEILEKWKCNSYYFQVVDNVMVFNVVTELEGRQLTKEQLETTRLGKLVNDIRRSSNDTTLSRRLKSLLKRWRILLGVDQPRQAQQRPPTQPPTQPQQQPQQQNLPRGM